MIVYSQVESDSVDSHIEMLSVSSSVVQTTVHSEELEYTDFEHLLRITQQSAPRSTQDDEFRILQ
jgi:hypothetical protein